jgi:hypothetical protein
MNKILLALIVVLALALPAMADVQLAKDFKLDGYVAAGYVVSTDYSQTISGIEHWFTDKDNDGSTWALQGDIGVTWKDTVRGYVQGNGMAGSLGFNSAFMAVGAEYYIYKTPYGKLGLQTYGNWTWIGGDDQKINYIDVDYSGEERSWIAGIVWRF